jgi:glycerophosphoryl diester phosphodiesterase
MPNDIKILWKKTFHILRMSIWQIFSTHLTYIALGVVIFAPLTGIAGQLILHFSGQSGLSDLDIAYFFLSPPGMLALILAASVMITILVFEQASLMAINAATTQRLQLHFIHALFFTIRRTRNIFLFAIQLVLRILFITLPFIGIGLALAWVMLTNYDINYYLAVKPHVVFIAAISIGLVQLTMAVVLIRNLFSWSLALPLILFNDVSPAQSFTKSEYLTQRNKELFLVMLGSLALTATLLTTVVLGAAHLLGSILAPFFFHSIPLLAPVLGGLVALWLLANLLITTVTSGSFAAVLILFYDRSGSKITAGNFAENQQNTRKQITAPLFFILLIASVAGAVLTGNQLLNTIPADNDTTVIAHRRAAGKTPENPLVSIRHAINDSADWVKLDVQETSDGNVIVIHDSDFMKLASAPLKVRDVALKEIQKTDIGNWLNSGLSTERVPTLAEALEVAKGNCHVLIELKYYGHNQQLEQRVAEIVEQAGMVKNIAIMSLKYEGIRKFRTLRPDWPVGLLSSKAIGKLSDLDVDFLAINTAIAKPAFIRRIQSTGKQVYVWTVNDQVAMSRMMTLGVDGLITDEPALAREVLSKNGGMNPVERLILHTAVLLNTSAPTQTYRAQSL